MSLSRRLARPMLSAVFIAGGIDTLRNPGPRVKVSEDVAPQLASKIGLPSDPELLVKLNAGVQVGAGVMMALGKYRRLSALLLIGSTIPTTYAGHRFWEMDDPQERAQQQMHFLKNVGLIGGLVLELVDTEGAPSLGWRARRVAKHAGAVISVGTSAGGAKTGALTGRARRRAAKAATKAAAGAQVGLHAAHSGLNAAHSGLNAAHSGLSAAHSGLNAGSQAGLHAAQVGLHAAHSGLSVGSHASAVTGKSAKQAGQAVSKTAQMTAKQMAKNAKKMAKNAKSVAAVVPTDQAGDLWSTGAGWAGEALNTGGHQAGHLLSVGSDRASHLLAAGSDLAGDVLSVGAKRAGESWHTAADHLPKR